VCPADWGLHRVPRVSGNDPLLHPVDWCANDPGSCWSRGGLDGADCSLRSDLWTIGDAILVGTDSVRLRPRARRSAPDWAGSSGGITTRGLATSRHGVQSLIGLHEPGSERSLTAVPEPDARSSEGAMGSFNALAYARMIANPLIDATRTAVLGHSEGTWLTPALPNRFPHPGAGPHQHRTRCDARPELHAGHAPPAGRRAL
jgi:hypothetical protein